MGEYQQVSAYGCYDFGQSSCLGDSTLDHTYYGWYSNPVPYYPPNIHNASYHTTNVCFGPPYSYESHSYSYENGLQDYPYPSMESYPYMGPQVDASYLRKNPATYNYLNNNISNCDNQGPGFYEPHQPPISEYGNTRTFTDYISSNEMPYSSTNCNNNIQDNYTSLNIQQPEVGEKYLEVLDNQVQQDKYSEIWNDGLEKQKQTFPQALQPAEVTEEISVKHGVEPAIISRKTNQTCPQCHKTFTRYSHLIIHMRIHNNDRPFFCRICARRFTQNANLLRHMSVHKIWPLNRRYTPLAINSRKFKAISAAIRKCKVTNNNPQNPRKALSFECRFCGKVFDRIHAIRSHLTEHKDKQLFHCLYPNCSATYRHLEVFLNHLDVAHGTNPSITHDVSSAQTTFICFRCENRYSNLSELSDHYQNYPEHQPHYGRKNFKLNHQDISTEPTFLSVQNFSSPPHLYTELLNSDSQIQTDYNDYIISNDFVNSASLNLEQNHQDCPKLMTQNHHTISNQLHDSPTTAHKELSPNEALSLLVLSRKKQSKRCKVCMRIFRQPSSLRRHLLMAHPKATALMLEHIRIAKLDNSSSEQNNNREVKQYPSELKCQICSKGYTNRGSFDQHVKFCETNQLIKERKERFRMSKRILDSSTLNSSVKEIKPPQEPEMTPEVSNRYGRGIAKIDYSVFGPSKRKKRNAS